jgi:hypothetical protein
MKRVLISLLLVLGFTSVSNGQNSTYGISLGVGSGFIMKQALDGGGSYDLNTSLSIGFQYTKKLNNTLHLMLSINWYKNEVTFTPNFNPNINITAKKYDLQLIYIPVFLKVDLSKYFFLNGGLIGDFDISKDSYITSQSGMGAGFGIGTEFLITEKLLIQIIPYANLHGLILTHKENYPERVFDTGIKLNLVLQK